MMMLPLSVPAGQIIEQWRGRRVLVVGDLMLDRYLHGQVHRISPEAPVPVVTVEEETLVPGGAANVACNIAALGGKPIVLGVIGDDAEGKSLRSLLEKRGVIVDQVILASDRPTTVKTRVVAAGQQIVRVDSERNGALPEDVAAGLRQTAGKLMDDVEAAVLSDYAKGVLEPGNIRAVLEAAAARGKPTVVDPKEAHFASYKGATVVTPNHHEAGAAVHRKIRDEESLAEVGRELLSMMGSHNLLITCGEKGMALFTEEGRVVRIPTVAREVFDVTGAGDTVVAALVLALAAGASLQDAAVVANLAAGIKVGKHGTATVTAEEILENA
jgi:rfaE bifunctional protein kinase chain/domain